MSDPTIRERLRELAEKTPEQQAAEGWAVIDQRFIRWHDRTCGVRMFKANRPECDCGLQEALDTLERRAIAAEEALEQLSDVGWVLARMTPEGERIDPPSGTWHDLDAALEQARAALEASRGSA